LGSVGSVGAEDVEVVVSGIVAKEPCRWDHGGDGNKFCERTKQLILEGPRIYTAIWPAFLSNKIIQGEAVYEASLLRIRRFDSRVDWILGVGEAQAAIKLLEVSPCQETKEHLARDHIHP
jgi:hypothetical protein